MARVVNLRRARKAAKRAEKREESERRTTPVSALDKARAKLEQRRHEGHKRDDDDSN
jgi:hypothetical protein